MNDAKKGFESVGDVPLKKKKIADSQKKKRIKKFNKR